jgi:hypothetical protein
VPFGAILACIYEDLITECSKCPEERFWSATLRSTKSDDAAGSDCATASAPCGRPMAAPGRGGIFVVAIRIRYARNPQTKHAMSMRIVYLDRL